MANPASVLDLEERFWRPLTDHEQSIAQRWLDDAYGILIGRRPTLEADVVAETVGEDNVIRVVCAMVARVFSNPEGKDREAIDDYSYGRSPVVRDGLLYVTAGELADISPNRTSRRSLRLVAYGDD